MIDRPATLALAHLGDPILRSPCQSIPDAAFDTPDLDALIDDRFALLDQLPNGICLAGPRAMVSYRYFVVSYRGWRLAVCNPQVLHVNPWAASISGEEGCLSLPGWTAMVRRSINLDVTARDPRGEPIELHGHWFVARLLAHETDHLDGHLYVDRAVTETLQQDGCRPAIETITPRFVPRAPFEVACAPRCSTTRISATHRRRI